MHKCVDVENGLNGLYVWIYAPFHREVEVVKILSMCKHKNLEKLNKQTLKKHTKSSPILMKFEVEVDHIVSRLW